MTTSAKSPGRPSRRERRFGPNTAERISAGCYGALIASSTLVGLGTADPLQMVLIVILTNLTYYATHVFAFTIGDPNPSGSGSWKVALHHFRVSAPIFSVSFAPLIVVLIIAALGFTQTVAVTGGFITAMLYLASVATTAAYLRGLRPFAVTVTAVATVVIAIALVVAKLGLH